MNGKRNILLTVTAIILVFFLVSCGDKNFKVIFKDFDGTTIKEDTVKYGGVVTVAPISKVLYVVICVSFYLFHKLTFFNF